MEVRILGSLEVLIDGRPVDVPAGRSRSLLALLALHAGEVVPADRIIEELWGDEAPATVTTALQGLVSNMRKRIEPDRTGPPRVLRTVAPGYLLAIDPSSVDANRFRHLVADAATATVAGASARLREALALWRGPALSDFVYEPFAQREINALEELRLAATEERISADLALGRHADVVAELESLVAAHPLRERLRARLMLALYRDGRQADALEVYRDARRTLVEELGIEPGPELASLERSILAHDASLDASLEESPAAGDEPWLGSERKTITVVFVELSAPAGTVDVEAAHAVVARSNAIAASVLRRHGATVEELVGDVVVGYFGVPVAHEDDPLRAVRAALDVRDAIATAGEDVGILSPVRAGIETGEVFVATSGAVSGEAVNAAAALQRAATDEILAGPGTRAIVGAQVVFDGARVIGLAPAPSRRTDVPMVGRAAELSRLHTAFERTVSDRCAFRFTVLGDAGIGKSRLAAAFVDSLPASARALIGRCPSYGDGITFWPLREALGGWSELTALTDGTGDGAWIAEQVGGALGWVQPSRRIDDSFAAFRRLFEVACGRGPMVVVLEDLHWAEPMLLDLVAYLAGEVRGPLFLLCVARPGLIEERPAWGAGRRGADTLFLEPLGEADTARLITDRLASMTMLPDVVARIVETAQGNPLFAEQMVAAFRDEGRVDVPASVDALLAARLDALGPAERDLIRCASVIGTDFSPDDLRALVPAQAHPFIDRHLHALEDKQLIRRGKRCGFRHVLIRLAAYRSLSKQARSDLHERMAARLGGAEGELEELVGYHLEQAFVNRRDLGPLDDVAHSLAHRAGDLLASAGVRALHRYDIGAAANLLTRALALLPDTHPDRRALYPQLVRAHLTLGSTSDADGVIATMLAQAGDDAQLVHLARIERMRLAMAIDPDSVTLQSIRDAVAEAIGVFDPIDETELALAYFVLALVEFRAVRMDDMERAARLCLEHADRSGEPREVMAARIAVAWHVVHGPMPVPDGIRVLEKLVPGPGFEHPDVLRELAKLHAMAGAFDEARSLIARARRLVQERMRGHAGLMLVAEASAEVEAAAGDAEAADLSYRVALQYAREAGLRESVALASAKLSRIASGRGDIAQADVMARLSEEHAPVEAVAARALSRSARALAGHQDAERLSREAIDLIPETMPNLRADLLMDLAAVLRAKNADAGPVVGEAIALYETKGNETGARRADGSEWRSA